MIEIIDRIERLEELALLTHGTLDVDKVKAKLKASVELRKERQKSFDKRQKALNKALEALIEEDRKRIDYLRSQISSPEPSSV